MILLDDIKPIKKLLVMDLLEAAGFDISEWSKYKGKTPSANPRFCYNWAFEQPGKAIALCLWHHDLELHDGTVVYHRTRKKLIAEHREQRPAVWKRRATEFSQKLELAYRQQLPVRVIIVARDDAERKSKAASARARLLDSVEWAITEFEPSTDECLIVRGGKPVVPPESSSDLELSWFEGSRRRAFIFHRQREAKARRAKIQEALASGGGRLLCEVPNCRFDFKARYGALGDGYAQVHHLDPLSSSPKQGRSTKLERLAIVCANCHVMIHRDGKSRPLEGLIR